MAEANPYEPPRASFAPAEWRPTIGSGQAAWLGCYGLNLLMPAVLGWSMLAPSGRWGMTLAVVALGLAGLVLVSSRPRLVAPSVTGAAVVAASQLMPMLQILAGLIALGLTGRGDVVDPEVGMPREATKIGFAGGALVTALTGVQLWAASLAIGFILVAIARAVGGRAATGGSGIQNA